MIVYKIRNKDGLFSSGGRFPNWSTKGGKVWKNIGGLKNHIRLIRQKDFYLNADIVEYQSIEKSITPVQQIILEQTQKDNEEKIKLHNEMVLRKRTEELKMLAQLKEKYE